MVTMNIRSCDAAPMSYTSYLAAEDSLNAQAAFQLMTGGMYKTECRLAWSDSCRAEPDLQVSPICGLEA